MLDSLKHVLMLCYHAYSGLKQSNATLASTSYHTVTKQNFSKKTKTRKKK